MGRERECVQVLVRGEARLEAVHVAEAGGKTGLERWDGTLLEKSRIT